VTLSGDGSSVIAAFAEGSLRRWDISTGEERSIARPRLEKVPPVGKTGQMRREFLIPESSVLSLAFSPDGQVIAAGTLSHDARGSIRIFRLRYKQEIQTIEAPCSSVQALCFTPDGRRIVAGLEDTSIVI
jgi:WD40 repeat protein